MAIDNQSGPWDEDTINMLYRAYQQHRDGIDYRHYRPIMQAARQQLARQKQQAADSVDQATMEQSIAAIQAEARRRYPAADQVESAELQHRRSTHRHHESLSDRLHRWISEVAGGIEQFIESINPARLVPIAITAALVVAVVPMVMTSGGGQHDDMMAAEVALLQQSPNAVSSELERLGEYQHGFSSSDSHYARAFSAGAIIVDLKTLDADANAEQIGRIMSSVRSGEIGESLDIAIEPSDGAAQQVAVVTSALNKHYQSDDHTAVYLFGQWVESAYLLSRIGEQSGNPAGIDQAMAHLPKIQALMEQEGYFAPRLQKDFSILYTIAEKGIDVQSLPRVSARLLKLRTVEAQQRG